MTARSSSQYTDELLQLSEEIGRIAKTLARMSPDPVHTPSLHASERSQLSAQTIAEEIRARRRRGRFFPQDLFADPAWDMLLDLLHSELIQSRVTISNLCAASGVPATTALRWINSMVQRGLIIRREDPLDRRRIFVELAPETSLALHDYFAEPGRVAND